jgi:GTP-binding protein Era
MNKRMVSIALNALDGVDLGLWVVDATKDQQIDQFMFGHIKRIKPQLLLIINKIDLVPKDQLYPMVDLYRKAYDFKELIPVSALKGDGVERIIPAIFKYLPEGEPAFAEDDLTDIPERQIVEEMIREKIYLLAQKEVPYSTAVHVEEFNEKGKLISIMADIWVEKESQKAILIGRGGEMIKKIGSMARGDIERLLGTKTFLDLRVKVKERWREKPSALDTLGIRS